MNLIIFLVVFCFQGLEFFYVYGIGVAETKCEDYRKMFAPTLRSFNDNNEDASPAEFPFMARIVSNSGKHNGILISDEFVLSVTGKGSAVHVILGDREFETVTDNTEPQQFDVIKQFPHPSFGSDSILTLKLLKLNGSVKFNEYIRPACLPLPKSIISQKLIEIGWGETSVRSNEFLHKVKLTLNENTICMEKVRRRGVINTTAFCAFVQLNDRDLCNVRLTYIPERNSIKVHDLSKGFNGAAVLNARRQDNFEHIVGITAFKYGCGKAKPTVFLDISVHTSWIESLVWPTSNHSTEMENVHTNKSATSRSCSAPIICITVWVAVIFSSKW